MIKLKKGNMIMLGIDEDNVNRLKQGKPIMVKGQELGIELDIFIVYGKELSDIQKEFDLPQVN